MIQVAYCVELANKGEVNMSGLNPFDCVPTEASVAAGERAQEEGVGGKCMRGGRVGDRGVVGVLEQARACRRLSPWPFALAGFVNKDVDQ